MKILRVGDPHVKVSNLGESARLMQFVIDKAREHKVDRIELLGDLFHTHAVIRLEVMMFWKHWLLEISNRFETIVLVGNHDQSGDYGSKEHALSVFKDMNVQNLVIIENPTVINQFAYMPYIHDNAKFTEMATELANLGGNFLVCHATFDGSKYDNGMYAPGGIDPSQIPFQTILSGHIHALQRYKTISGKEVIYPGTARWDSNSDANQTKGIWIYEHDESGKIVKEEMIPTNTVCTPIISIEWKEGEEEPTVQEGSKTTIELIGSSDWISKQKTKLKGKVGIKAKITDKKNTENRKSGSSLQEFLDKIFVTTLSKEDLEAKAKEWGIV